MIPYIGRYCKPSLLPNFLTFFFEHWLHLGLYRSDQRTLLSYLYDKKFKQTDLLGLCTMQRSEFSVLLERMGSAGVALIFQEDVQIPAVLHISTYAMPQKNQLQRRERQRFAE